MSRRLGNHRVRAERSAANKARANIDRLVREIDAAKKAGQWDRVATLEREHSYAVINSLVS